MTTPQTITITADPSTWSQALWAVRRQAAKLPFDSGAIDVVAALDDMMVWAEGLTPIGGGR